MEVVYLVIAGRRGLFAGERFVVPLGSEVTVGRSRGCEISIAHTRAFARIGRSSLERNRSYRKISRRHFTIAFLDPGRIVVRDVSTNGTLVDGSRIREMTIALEDLVRRPVRILLGEGEEVLLHAGTGSVPPESERLDGTVVEHHEPSSSGRI